MEATLYFDGGVRGGLCAYGWILKDSSDETRIIACGNKTCGKGTSNISEYRALIAGLFGGIDEGVDIIHIFGDSQLVVRQINGTFRVKKEELRKHRDKALELLASFDYYTIKWIPRKENQEADTLVNEVFDKRNGKCKKKPRRNRN